MELTLKNEFYELTMDEMQVVDGGGAVEAAQMFFGVVGLAWSIPAACLNVGVGLGIAGASLACIDAALN